MGSHWLDVDDGELHVGDGEGVLVAVLPGLLDEAGDFHCVGTACDHVPSGQPQVGAVGVPVHRCPSSRVFGAVRPAIAASTTAVYSTWTYSPVRSSSSAAASNAASMAWSTAGMRRSISPRLQARVMRSSWLGLVTASSMTIAWTSNGVAVRAKSAVL